MSTRNVTAEAVDPRERFVLYRLCDCPTCGGRGQVERWRDVPTPRDERCPDCRGEGRVREEVATCESPEAVGVALVTLGREGEWDECPIGVLDRLPECETCDGSGRDAVWSTDAGTHVGRPCPTCKGSGVKPTGTWIVRPWMPSARNVRDAARTLAKQRVQAATKRLRELGERGA